MNTRKLLSLVVILYSVSLSTPVFCQALDLSLAPNEDTYYDLLTCIVEYAPYEFIERLYDETSHLLYIHEGRSMLSIAAYRSDDPQVVALLMRHRQTLDDPDKQGFTPLMYAVLSERAGTVRLLLSSGANVNYQSMDGFSALHLAVGNNEHPDIARMLLDAGADLRLKTKFGLSVHDAIMQNPALKDSVLAEEIYWKSSPE